MIKEVKIKKEKGQPKKLSALLKQLRKKGYIPITVTFDRRQPNIICVLYSTENGDYSEDYS
jgi:hypothetical protein